MESRAFFEKNSFFFLVFAPDFVEIRGVFEIKTFFVFTPEFVKIRDEDLYFFVYILEFKALKFLCLPKISLCPLPLLSHAILAPGLGCSLIELLELAEILFISYSLMPENICWLQV